MTRFKMVVEDAAGEAMTDIKNSISASAAALCLSPTVAAIVRNANRQREEDMRHAVQLENMKAFASDRNVQLESMIKLADVLGIVAAQSLVMRLQQGRYDAK